MLHTVSGPPNRIATQMQAINAEDIVLPILLETSYRAYYLADIY
jgi:hypothetical protein